LGIDYLNEISTSQIWSAIMVLVEKTEQAYRIQNNNVKHISFLCDLLLTKGFKLSSIYDYNAIQVLDHLCVWHPCLDYYLILNQKLGIIMNEKLSLYKLITSSKEHKDFSLVLYLLQNNLSIFIGNPNWISNQCTYKCHELFAYFDNFIEMCSNHWQKSRQATELEIWELIIGAGNIKTIESFAPKLKEPNKFSGWVRNYKTLIFLADSNKHPLSVVWEQIQTTNSFVQLWLQQNHNISLDVRNKYYCEIYHVISAVPHAIKNSNFLFFEQLNVPFSEALSHYFSMISSSFLEKIPIERLLAFLAQMEFRKENIEPFVEDFIRVDFVEPLVYLFGDSIPKVEPKLKYLYTAIDKEKPKCSLYLMNLFKDKLPDEIHYHAFSDVKGINKMCQNLNLNFRYKKHLNSFKLIKTLNQ
jgi:hypothetical protein